VSAKYGSGNRSGGIDIKAFPDTFVIRHAESENAAIHTGNDVPPGTNLIERARQRKAGSQYHRHYDNNTQVETFHHFSSSSFELRFSRRNLSRTPHRR
jgi:hypothetical protein